MPHMALQSTVGALDVLFITCMFRVYIRIPGLTTVLCRLAGKKPFEAKVGGIRYALQLEPLKGKAGKAGMSSRYSQIQRCSQ